MANDTTISYILRLQDEISATLKRVEANTESMNEKMRDTKGAVEGIKKAFVEFFAIEKIFEFGKKSFEAFTEANKASAQLNATLTSTGHAAGMSRKELDELSEAMSKNSTYSKTQVTSMQSVLTTFTAINKDVFPQAQQAIADLATKMGGDLQGAAVQVGKALQDPEKGITALRRVGVNFNEAQTEVIKKLVETGHAAQAQQLILKELNTEFGGSAAAAAKADPWKVFANQAEEQMIKIGKIISRVGTMLMPMFDKLLVGIEPVIDLLESIFESILPPIISLLEPIFKVFQNIFKIVQAIIQPILGALTPALDAIKNEVSLISAYFNKITPILTTMGHIIGTVLSVIIKVSAYVLNAEISFARWLTHTNLFKTVWDAIFGVVSKVWKFVSGIVDKLKSLAGVKDIAISTTESSSDVSEGEASAEGAGAEPSTATTAALESAPKEQKATNIYITINDLVKDLNIQTPTLAMSEGQIKDFVVKTFLEAVNGFNLIAGQ